MKQTLWIITELFPPEETSTAYIMGEIANAMTSKYDVRVICGPAVYDSSKRIVTDGVVISDSIRVTRVNAVAENKDSKISRIKKFLLISWRLYRVAKRNIRQGDKVLMVTNPFPLVVLMGYLRRHRAFTLDMLVHDVAPENLFTDIHIPKCLYSTVESVFNKAYASVDLLISIGRDMSEILTSKVKKGSNGEALTQITLIENWGDIANVRPAASCERDKIVIQYAGNIGNAQGVGEFVDVLQESECKDVVFGIWGTGNAELSIKEKVKSLGLENIVHFHGPYSRSQQQNVLNDCDIALVRLVRGMYGLGVPSKTYNILAAGKPILYIGERNTEVWRIIEENHNGFCFEPSDVCGLKEFLCGLSTNKRETLSEMGRISRKLAEDKYSKAVILKKYLDII